MVCITIRFSFMVISSNQLYLVHFFLFDGNQQKFPFLEQRFVNDEGAVSQCYST